MPETKCFKYIPKMYTIFEQVRLGYNSLGSYCSSDGFLVVLCMSLHLCLSTECLQHPNNKLIHVGNSNSTQSNSDSTFSHKTVPIPPKPIPISPKPIPISLLSRWPIPDWESAFNSVSGIASSLIQIIFWPFADGMQDHVGRISGHLHLLGKQW